MKHYAVRGGPRPGVYGTWDEAQKVTNGHKGALCKKFDDFASAEAFATHPAAISAPSVTTSETGFKAMAPTARYYLEVPFAQKDQAKALGAKWDSERKKWFAPSDRSLDQFAQWFPGSGALSGNSQSSALSRKRKAHVEVGLSGPPPADELALYTDGACHGNQNVANMSCPAGWGVVVVDSPRVNEHRSSGSTAGRSVAELFGPVVLDAQSGHFIGAEIGSNNTGELSAMCEALLWLRDFESANRPAVICYDSTYAAHITTGRYNAQKNIALARHAQGLYKEVATRRSLRLNHVKGHSGDKWNDVADSLANRGAVGQRCTVGRWAPSEARVAALPASIVTASPKAELGLLTRPIHLQMPVAEHGQAATCSQATATGGDMPVARPLTALRPLVVERWPAVSEGDHLPPGANEPARPARHAAKRHRIANSSQRVDTEFDNSCIVVVS